MVYCYLKFCDKLSHIVISGHFPFLRRNGMAERSPIQSHSAFYYAHSLREVFSFYLLIKWRNVSGSYHVCLQQCLCHTLMKNTHVLSTRTHTPTVTGAINKYAPSKHTEIHNLHIAVMWWHRHTCRFLIHEPGATPAQRCFFDPAPILLGTVRVSFYVQTFASSKHAVRAEQ